MLVELARRAFALALFATIAFAIPAAAQDKAYVLFSAPNLAGDGVDAGHEGWIDALSVTGAIGRPDIDPKPGTVDINIGIGELAPIVFTKQADGSSWALPLTMTSQLTIPTVDIDLCSAPGAGQQCDFSITLKRVRIDSYDIGGSTCTNASSCGDSTLVEKVALRFDEICWRHAPSDTEAGWDTVNSSFSDCQ